MHGLIFFLSVEAQAVIPSCENVMDWKVTSSEPVGAADSYSPIFDQYFQALPKVYAAPPIGQAPWKWGVYGKWGADATDPGTLAEQSAALAAAMTVELDWCLDDMDPEWSCNFVCVGAAQLGKWGALGGRNAYPEDYRPIFWDDDLTPSAMCNRYDVSYPGVSGWSDTKAWVDENCSGPSTVKAYGRGILTDREFP